MSCCPTVVKPVTSDYKGQGLQSYIAGTPGSTTKGVIIVSDIFGFHPNAFHLADKIASAGFLVVLPDLFPNNSGWPTHLTPIDRESDAWKAFFTRLQDLEPVVGELKKNESLLKSFGCTSVGLVGLCWGAKPALLALKEGTGVSCCCPHPSALTAEAVIPAKGPIAFLMSKNDAPLDDVREELEKNEYAAKNFFIRYEDLHHGFLGARGPLQDAFAPVTDSAIAARVAEAAETVITFLKNTV